MPRNPNPIDDTNPCERLRAAVIAHGPVKLPNLARILGISYREAHSAAEPMVKRGYLDKDAEGQLTFVRHPERRPKIKPTAAQQPSVRLTGLPPRRAALPGMGFSQAKGDATGLPSSEDFVRAGGTIEVLPTSWRTP